MSNYQVIEKLPFENIESGMVDEQSHGPSVIILILHKPKEGKSSDDFGVGRSVVQNIC